MSSSEFDSIKVQKTDAIRRFNRNRNFISCFHRTITALGFLCAFPYFHLLKELISSFYISLFSRQLYVFCLINAMIFAIYRFSATVSQPDLYNQYISFSSTSGRRDKLAHEEIKSVVWKPMEIQLPEEEKFSDKQIVVCENAQSALEGKERNPIGYLLEPKKLLRLRRTRSDKYTMAKKKKNNLRELRPSESENGRELVVAVGGEERKSMEDMNSDEFRFTIERFIASNRKLLRDENIAAVMEERQCLF